MGSRAEGNGLADAKENVDDCRRVVGLVLLRLSMETRRAGGRLHRQSSAGRVCLQRRLLQLNHNRQRANDCVLVFAVDLTPHLLGFRGGFGDVQAHAQRLQRPLQHGEQGQAHTAQEHACRAADVNIDVDAVAGPRLDARLVKGQREIEAPPKLQDVRPHGACHRSLQPPGRCSAVPGMRGQEKLCDHLVVGKAQKVPHLRGHCVWHQRQLLDEHHPGVDPA